MVNVWRREHSVTGTVLGTDRPLCGTRNPTTTGETSIVRHPALVVEKDRACLLVQWAVRGVFTFARCNAEPESLTILEWNA